MKERFIISIAIEASTEVVWKTLTDPNVMKQWMGESEMQIEIDTTWKVGSPIIIRGFHHVKFENRGVVVEFEKENKLSYTHLSSVSRLPDIEENYSTIRFHLDSTAGGTELDIMLENFPTESIRKHLEFYWRGTVATIKSVAEKLLSDEKVK
jgi:uncharacterized protein YndB with AHSA1/START domain